MTKQPSGSLDLHSTYGELDNLVKETGKAGVENGTVAENLTFNVKQSWDDVAPDFIPGEFSNTKNMLMLHRQKFHDPSILANSGRYEKVLVGGSDVGETVSGGTMSVSNSSGGFSSQGYKLGVRPEAPFACGIVRIESHSGTVGTSGEASDVHFGFMKDNNNMVLAGYNTAGGNFQIFEKDANGGLNTSVGGSPPSGKFDMMCGIHGDEVFVAYRDPSETHPDWNWVGYATGDFTNKNDLYDKNVYDDTWELSFRIATADTQSVEISDVMAYHGMGTGIAGPNPITYPDGGPLIENNKLWFSINSRGGGNRGKQLVCTLDLGTYDVELKSVLWAEVQGTSYISNYVAPHIVYLPEDDEFVVAWSGFGNGPSDPKTDYTPNRPVFISRTSKDVRKGSHVLKCENMNLPRNGPSHDPFLVKDMDSKKWTCTYNSDNMDEYRTAQTTDSGLTSGWNTTSTFTDTNVAHMEGGTIARVNNEYVISYAYKGDPTLMRWVGYNDVGTKLGDISLNRNTGDPDAPWPTVVPVPDGDKTKYLLLTMDETQKPNMVDTSQGSLMVYEANQKADGYEYPKRELFK